MINVLERERMSLMSVKEKLDRVKPANWIVVSETEHTVTLYKSDNNVDTIITIFVSSYTASVTFKQWLDGNADGLPSRLYKKFVKREDDLMDKVKELINS